MRNEDYTMSYKEIVDKLVHGLIPLSVRDIDELVNTQSKPIVFHKRGYPGFSICDSGTRRCLYIQSETAIEITRDWVHGYPKWHFMATAPSYIAKPSMRLKEYTNEVNNILKALGAPFAYFIDPKDGLCIELPPGSDGKRVTAPLEMSQVTITELADQDNSDIEFVRRKVYEEHTVPSPLFPKIKLWRKKWDLN